MIKRYSYFRPNVRMGKECDQNYFDRGMIVDARQGGLNILEMLISWDFHAQQNHPASSSSAGKNALLMSEVSGEGPDWSKLTGR